MNYSPDGSGILLLLADPETSGLEDNIKDIANSRCLHELKHKCSAPNYYIKSTNINEKLKSVKRPLNCFKKNKKIIILRLELKQIFTL